MKGPAEQPGTSRSGFVLVVLASAQFLMTLDSSVMNVSIQYVAKDLHTTVTGIQTADHPLHPCDGILHDHGRKDRGPSGPPSNPWPRVDRVRSRLGNYALAPNLGTLLIGWWLLEGLGAALILPAIVALVAVNFPKERRSFAYGLIAAASAIAIAAEPLIGGAATTFASWRFVFVGEVVIVLVIIGALRKVTDRPVAGSGPFDFVGAALSIVGLASTAFGVLRSSQWGVVSAKPGAPQWIGVSPVVWLVLGGLLLIWVFFVYERHLENRGTIHLFAPRCWPILN